MPKKKICYICGEEFDSSGRNRRTYCFGEKCIETHRENQRLKQKESYKRCMERKKARRKYKEEYRSTKLERRDNAKKNGWRCLRCNQELFGDARFYCKDCLHIVSKNVDTPRHDDEFAYA